MATPMMRAARFHRYGSAEELVIEEIPRPGSPTEKQVLVKVHATGVNPIDVAVRGGHVHNRLPISFPAIPGVELSGTVEEVGPEVTRFKKGDAVYGNNLFNIGNGTLVEYILMPEQTLAPMPRNLDFDHAATVAHGARTAWTGLFELGDLQAGQRILIHGGAGGVGMYAVQLAHWKGAYVIATSSKHNHEFLHSLGADEVIEYTQTKFEDVVHDVDMVFDLVGGDTMERSWQVLKKGGILVSATGFPTKEAAEQHGVRSDRVMYPKDLQYILTQVTALVEAGQLKPFIRKIFTLEEATHAHLMTETRRGRGRVVIHIAD